MTSIFAVAFFLSTTTRRPLVAVAGGIGLTIISRIFNADYLRGVGGQPDMPNNDIDSGTTSSSVRRRPRDSSTS